jgi:elongation factor Ts
MSNLISAKLVNELRQKTGAGLMECKKSLTEAEGDLEKAEVLLRKKGIATAAKKAGRATSQGIVESYIHLGGKVGVLIELNCETDFVAKTDEFKALARDLCMQIAAAMPLYVSREEVPAKDVEEEREIAASQMAGKPAHAIEKIVLGKLDKFFSGICLIEQPFVKNPDQTIRDLLNEKVTKLGENIVVRRFVRYQLGA